MLGRGLAVAGLSLGSFRVDRLTGWTGIRGRHLVRGTGIAAPSIGDGGVVRRAVAAGRLTVRRLYRYNSGVC